MGLVGDGIPVSSFLLRFYRKLILVDVEGNAPSLSPSLTCQLLYFTGLSRPIVERGVLAPPLMQIPRHRSLGRDIRSSLVAYLPAFLSISPRSSQMEALKIIIKSEIYNTGSLASFFLFWCKAVSRLQFGGAFRLRSSFHSVLQSERQIIFLFFTAAVRLIRERCLL